MKAAIAALSLAVAVSACGREIGHKFDGSAAQLLTPGATTVENAVARVGLEVMFDPDNRMIRIVQRGEHGPDDGHWYY